jgi:hypothetical protein
MKKFLVIIVAIAVPALSFSQTTAEWLHQKKTQRKYLIQQIVAFQTYLGYLKQGYSIAQKGISTVQHIKKGEWNLHKDYFGSLKIVNPSIVKLRKVAELSAMLVKTVKQTKSLISYTQRTNDFNTDELKYVEKTGEKIISECLETIDELMTVITSGEVEMKDDERIRRIEKIYAQTQEHYVFQQSFGNSVTMLSKQRLRERIEIETSMHLNGLK